jgi:hypothetical protein
VAGIAVTVFGAVLLVDALGGVDLRFSGLAPLACAVIGSILVATGLGRGS